MLDISHKCIQLCGHAQLHGAPMVILIDVTAPRGHGPAVRTVGHRVWYGHPLMREKRQEFLQHPVLCALVHRFKFFYYLDKIFQGKSRTLTNKKLSYLNFVILKDLSVVFGVQNCVHSNEIHTVNLIYIYTLVCLTIFLTHIY